MSLSLEWGSSPKHSMPGFRVLDAWAALNSCRRGCFVCFWFYAGKAILDKMPDSGDNDV